jgi:anti-anti-sigma factor
METLVEVNKKEENWIMIFNISGELDETNADKTFTGIYKEIWEFAEKKILLDLTGLRYLNSKSIWYIADIFSNIEENDGQMYISNCDEWVKDVLELVWITTIVPTVETKEEAIKEMS